MESERLVRRFPRTIWLLRYFLLSLDDPLSLVFVRLLLVRFHAPRAFVDDTCTTVSLPYSHLTSIESVVILCLFY